MINSHQCNWVDYNKFRLMKENSKFPFSTNVTFKALQARICMAEIIIFL